MGERDRPEAPGESRAHLVHLQASSYGDAELAWSQHVHGAEGLAPCPQCEAAPGPPPPAVTAEERGRYACPEGLRLHEAMVAAAHQAYAARPEQP